jgi:hypothetical protein
VPNPSLPNTFKDVQMTVLSWAPIGSPAPQVSVDWHCRLVQFQIIL